MPVKTFKNYIDFKEVINSGTPVVIDFWATWCGPCRMISPIFEDLSGKATYATVEFYKVDVDAEPEISREVGIRAMPTFATFLGGQKVEELVGANQSGLLNLLKNASNL
ncbi:thioredoxin [Pluteus cervinus]|uniref:Thioredoxin n=1 Tax=Pluteus cervinus TaxID=181527 RepID=A0ACD3ALG1_9AGAR|nr:thioredoxin [Pluteus cervinus]